jgi:hypothetical protein
MAARQRERYRAGRERALEYAREYRHKNIAAIKQKQGIYRKSNPEKIRANALQRLYGIDLETFQALAAEQDGRCAICQRRTKLCVDHEHESHLVRGLLCANCNCGLGYFDDEPDRLAAALEYLSSRSSSLRLAI